MVSVSNSGCWAHWESSSAGTMTNIGEEEEEEEEEVSGGTGIKGTLPSSSATSLTSWGSCVVVRCREVVPLEGSVPTSVAAREESRS